MKLCPFCGSEIRDEAIKCKWCLRMLDEPSGSSAGPAPTGGPWPTPAGGPSSAPAADEALQYTHSGQRYLLGYGTDIYGIWDRQGPEGPVERYPRTGEGWQVAWARYSTLEPHPVQVGLGPPGPGPSGLAPAGPADRPASPWANRRARPTSVNPLWWLAPVLVGWIGGLVAWLVNRDIDPRVARYMLLAGIVSSIVAAVLLFGVLGREPGSGL